MQVVSVSPGETAAQLPKVSGEGRRGDEQIDLDGPSAPELSHVNCVSGMVCACVCVCVSHSVVPDYLWLHGLSMEISRQEY